MKKKQKQNRPNQKATKPVAWTSKEELNRMPKDEVAAVWLEKENETDIPLYDASLLSEYEKSQRSLKAKTLEAEALRRALSGAEVPFAHVDPMEGFDADVSAEESINADTALAEQPVTPTEGEERVTQNPISERTDRIRQLNDQFRKGRGAGRIHCMGDLAHEGWEFQARAIEAVVNFNAFDQGNDPYGEHDFGAFNLDGKRLMFKIEYYNLGLDAGADDPADPKTCCRVLTIFYAEDY